MSGLTHLCFKGRNSYMRLYVIGKWSITCMNIFVYMLERYGYPEQSLTQVLIHYVSMESWVSCLSIQRKSGENIQILYVMFHYHCGLILWRFWKVSVINTEIVDILHKAMKTVLRWDKEFWREGGAAIVNQILWKARYDSCSN